MIYDYKITTGKGETLDLADFKGKVILVVNTATGCGSTPTSSRRRVLKGSVSTSTRNF